MKIIKLKDLKLIETVKNKKPVGMIEFELPRRNKTEHRQVRQWIYIDKVKLSPSNRKKSLSQVVETNIVIAAEIDSPAGQQPVVWVLLTNVPIDNVDNAYKIVKWYLCCWQIEVYISCFEKWLQN